MNQLQKLYIAIVNFLLDILKATKQFPRRIRPNLRESSKWFSRLFSGDLETREKLFEYFRWHFKEIVFCVLLAVLIAGVDKVQQFFSAYALDILQGPESFARFAFAFAGNGFVIFWLCYVFWHKPKRTTLLVGILGKRRAESYRNYYKKPGNVWRVAVTAAMPLLLTGAGLAQSIIKNSQSGSVVKIVWFLNSYPLPVLGLAALLFLGMAVLFQPRTPVNATLGTLQANLWRNMAFMIITVIGLLFVFYGYHQLQSNHLLLKGIALFMLVFAPPLVLALMLHGFSECLVKSAEIVTNKENGQVAAAKRFAKSYNVLLWTSYLSSFVALVLLNMKDVTTTEAFSTLVFPVAMLIFIAIAYYQAIDWLSYNMSTFRFSILIIVVIGLMLTGPQRHYEIKYKARSEAGKQQRASLEVYFIHWLKDRFERGILGTEGNNNIYLVATEGGGSRAGAWTTAVLTGIDEALQGKFKQQCFAISGISGGSIGTVATLAWWDNAQSLSIAPQDLYRDSTARARYIGRIFERNYISSALAGIFFYDGFQQNSVFSWLYPSHYSRTDRHQDEESDAVQRAMLDVFGDYNRSRIPELYLKQKDFLDLYYKDNTGTPRIGLPLFFSNTCRVEEGRRSIPSPILINTESVSKGVKWPGNAGILDIIEAKDKDQKTNMRLSLGEVASLSELFPFVNSTVHMGVNVGTFMDGGVYENMGLTTLYEISTAAQAILLSPNEDTLCSLFPDDGQRQAFLTQMKAVKIKMVLIFNTEHLDHLEHAGRKRTLQFFDPITTLLQTPFGGHTDHIYHKTINDFGVANVVEFPYMLNKEYDDPGNKSKKPDDPIVMSRWLSRHDLDAIMRTAELRIKSRIKQVEQ